jgi:hypothetical protein
MIPTVASGMTQFDGVGLHLFWFTTTIHPYAEAAGGVPPVPVMTRAPRL